MKKIYKRVTSPTPSFFKYLRTIGLCLAAAGGAILAAPVTLPASVISIGGYVLVAGSVISAVSQVTTEQE